MSNRQFHISNYKTVNGVSYEPELIALIDRASVLSYVLPSDPCLDLLNAAIGAAVDNGSFAKCDIWHMLGTDAVDVRFTCLNIVNPLLHEYTLISAPTHSLYGFKGVANDVPGKKYIKSNYNAFVDGVNYTQNNAHIGVYQYATGVNVSPSFESTLIGSHAGKTYLSPSLNGTSVYGSINSGSDQWNVQANTTLYSKPCTWSIERSTSTHQRIYHNDVQIKFDTKASGALTTGELILFNLNGSSDSVVTAAWAGASGIRLHNIIDNYRLGLAGL